MRVSPGLGSMVIFGTSFVGALLCGFVFPSMSAGSPELTPWMFNGLLACGAVALFSAPFGWRGYLNWRSRRLK